LRLPLTRNGAEAAFFIAAICPKRPILRNFAAEFEKKAMR